MDEASSPGDPGSPDWPPWFAFAGFGGALIATLVAVAVVFGVAGIDVDDDSAVLTVVATLIQSAFFVGVAYLLARSVARPRSWHFGFRRAPLWPTVGWAALGMLAFYALGAIYIALVDPDVEQDVTDSLGAGDSTLGLIAAGVMVIAIAPVVEEVFFRGFFYRALRTRWSIPLAAVVGGLVFGVIHYDFEGPDGLLLLPPLAALGAILCLVYERTGTLYAVIGMHAFNNTVAFAAQADDGWRVAVVAGPLMLAAVAIVPRLLPSGPAPLPPGQARADSGAQLSLPL
ncbi:MAG: CPBP family intramembrane glutamic endopeptidase [Thermoleophilaceae bacterium]